MSVYTAVLTPYEGGYTVEVPDVPGCVTGGASIDEALHMAKDALGGCLCVYQDEGIELPAARTPDRVPLQPGQFAALVEIDLVDYRKSTDTRAVRKNVSMPAWLAYLADQRGLNCSQVLQDALRAQLRV